jgi:large subunit ribosomal protein L1
MAENKIMESIKKAIEGSKERKFLESIELSFNLRDIDLSIPKNRVDEDIQLPKGRGKRIKIGIFGSEEIAIKAKGEADLIVKPEDIESIAGDKKRAKKIAIEHGWFLAEAPLMPVIGKRLGVFLGPRGKMPRPVPPGSDPKPLIKNLRKTIKVRSKDKMTFHTAVGTKDMKLEDLAENIEAVIKRVERKLEKGHHNIKNIYVKTTMGPAIKVEWR